MSLEEDLHEGDSVGMDVDVATGDRVASMSIDEARELFQEAFRSRDVLVISDRLARIPDKNSEVARLLASGVAQFGRGVDILVALRHVDVMSRASEILVEGVITTGELSGMILALDTVWQNPKSVLALARAITIFGLPETSEMLLSKIGPDSEAGRLFVQKITSSGSVKTNALALLKVDPNSEAAMLFVDKVLSSNNERIIAYLLRCLDCDSMAAMRLATVLSSRSPELALKVIETVPEESAVELILAEGLVENFSEFVFEKASDVLRRRPLIAYKLALKVAGSGDIGLMADTLLKLKGWDSKARECLVWQIAGSGGYDKMIELLRSRVVDCSSEEGRIFADAIAMSTDSEWIEQALSEMGREDSLAKTVLIRHGVLYRSDSRLLVVALALVDHNSDIGQDLAEDITSRSDVGRMKEALKIAARGSKVETELILGIAEKSLHADDFADLLDRAGDGSGFGHMLTRKLIRDGADDGAESCNAYKLRSIDSVRGKVIFDMLMGCVDPSSDVACLLAVGLIRYHFDENQIREIIEKLQEKQDLLKPEEDSRAATILKRYLAEIQFVRERKSG
jgi:hypothetical protein